MSKATSAFRLSFHGKPCPYCKRLMQKFHPKLEPTRDHIVPRSRNGREIIIACIQCNGIKGNMLPGQWQAWMAAHPNWWLLSKYDLRAIWRNRAQLGLPTTSNSRPRQRQGSPPLGPIAVPPEYIWKRREDRLSKLSPELIQRTIEADAKLRDAGSPSGKARRS